IRLRPLRPMLPVVATAPACNHEDSLAIGFLEKVVGLEFAFQPDRIEPHVLHISELVVNVIGVVSQHHVRRVAAAANQNLLAVYAEYAIAALVELRSDFSNSEMRVRRIGHLS